MDQLDAFGRGVQLGVLWGALLGAVAAGAWSGWTVRGEDARAIAVVFVVLGAFAGSTVGALCGTLTAVVHQVAQRFEAAGAWWVSAAAALITGLITVGGFGLWPLLFQDAVPRGLQVGWVLVCAVVAAWQVRRVQRHPLAGSSAPRGAGRPR
ncbi:hypothetical protein [Kineococcus sp. SYSU DK002]|uniref:hypothetical protein n=1 Tax=Kineococcus sp. SYSU DK002 TaxID=3383123 RepID=UPI003D7C6F8F